MTLLFVPLFLVGCTTPTADPVTVELHIPEGGFAQPLEEQIDLGAEVTLLVTSEFDDRVHVHGYEFYVDAPAGETVESVFEANMAGTYEIESHETDQVYMLLTVS
ncbi:MAG: hypothetical protein GX596_02165 [Propionibacterium sp.]|nr:hypothetical protein [Propionibacterium sp.]